MVGGVRGYITIARGMQERNFLCVFSLCTSRIHFNPFRKIGIHGKTCYNLFNSYKDFKCKARVQNQFFCSFLLISLYYLGHLYFLIHIS